MNLKALKMPLICGLFAMAAQCPAADTAEMVLKHDHFRHYVEAFNQSDADRKTNYISNRAAWGWLDRNIPFFECSDKELEEIYYFRWWTFRKHICETPEGFVVTEFLPEVPWAGKKYNTISCSAAHHFYEGRWLRDRKYLKDYAYFWFRKGGEPRRYSFWAADSIRAWTMVTEDQQVGIDLLPDLIENYHAWEKDHQDANGLFWQTDDRDGMEASIGGSGFRPTINSYLYGDAVAIGDIAKWAGKGTESLEFRTKADQLRELVEDRLWDETMGFYKTLPRGENQSLVEVRELAGLVPWCFDLPKPGHELAWRQLMDTNGFYAPYGPTTAERRHPRFMFKDDHECLWNGPSWPFATAQTLTALANLLNDYKQDYVGKSNYLELLKIYAHSQHLTLPNGEVIPFIDENLDPFSGDWLARSILYQHNREDKDRGRDYNHSTFDDLIISGLVGLRPRMDQWVEINPLVPEGALDYFCLDGVRYHDFDLTILYDRTGERYGKGAGVHVFADGQEIGSSTSLGWFRARLPQTTAGWSKYEDNPVIGGDKPMHGMGTVFDIGVLREDGKYRMWGSWRPKASVALFESADGTHWSDPVVALPPNPASGWEDDVNRPTVLKRADGYHLWYTGQARGHSWIGYATSPDGQVWKRMSGQPVLSPELPWEKVALMSPNVIWDQTEKVFKMWYSGGEQYEPNAIGYATSPDGLHWTKNPANPVFVPDPAKVWEQERVAGCQVFQWHDWYYIFYIGYRDIDHAQIGLARSRDGFTHWERHPENPIVRPGQDAFDQDACYKPYALYDGQKWLLWYNGRHGWLEQIALVTHPGEALFDH